PTLQTFAVERARAGAANDERIVHDGDERACYFAAHTPEQIARFSPESAADDAARERSHDGTRRIRVEDDGGLTSIDFARPKLCERAACRLLSHGHFVVQLGEETARAPIAAATPLAALVFRDRCDRNRRVRTRQRALEPSRQHHRASRRGARKGGSLA